MHDRGSGHPRRRARRKSVGFTYSGAELHSELEAAPLTYRICRFHLLFLASPALSAPRLDPSLNYLQALGATTRRWHWFVGRFFFLRVQKFFNQIRLGALFCMVHLGTWKCVWKLKIFSYNLTSHNLVDDKCCKILFYNWL